MIKFEICMARLLNLKFEGHWWSWLNSRVAKGQVVHES